MEIFVFFAAISIVIYLLIEVVCLRRKNIELISKHGDLSGRLENYEYKMEFELKKLEAKIILVDRQAKWKVEVLPHPNLNGYVLQDTLHDRRIYLIPKDGASPLTKGQVLQGIPTGFGILVDHVESGWCPIEEVIFN